MNQQELLTAPASTLTRKQRKDRAALKRQLAASLKVLPGYAIGRVRTPRSYELPGAAITFESPGPIGQAIESGKRGGTVMVRLLDEHPQLRAE